MALAISTSASAKTTCPALPQQGLSCDPMSGGRVPVQTRYKIGRELPRFTSVRSIVIARPAATYEVRGPIPTVRLLYDPISVAS
jgi:hypothetical protein